MTIISILLISLLTSIHPTFSISTSHHNHIDPPPGKHEWTTPVPVVQACKATRYIQLCEDSIIEYSYRNATEIIHWALYVSYHNVLQGHSIAQSVFDASPGNHKRIMAAKNCIDDMENSAYRLKSAVDAFRRGEMKNGRAWASAALTYQYDCWSALKYVNDMMIINQTMSFMNTSIGFTSNALSFMRAYEVFGNKTASWGPVKTEREGFWEGGGGTEAGGPELKIRPFKMADVSVCKGGREECTFETVQEAVNAAPDWERFRFVIYVLKGFYEETVRVGIGKQNLMIVGEGMGQTVISGALNVGQPGLSTYNTATFRVYGDGFMARGLTIQNTAGPNTHQAVAFMSDSDRSIIEECEFLGNQDTLYARSLRQVYKSCRIEGNIDFIFGNSASIFQECTILVRPRQLKPEKGEDNVITAHGRTDPAQTTGFVFNNCSINGTEEYMKLYKSNPKVHKTFLGRPWKEFSRTVFIGCNMEALITPQGWMPWKDEFALKTLYYGEFNNSGKGSDMAGRVKWSNRIPGEHVNVYSVRNFLQGDQWKLKPS